MCPDSNYPTNKSATKEDEQECNVREYSAMSESALNVYKRNRAVSNRSDLVKPNGNHASVSKCPVRSKAGISFVFLSPYVLASGVYQEEDIGTFCEIFFLTS